MNRNYWHLATCMGFAALLYSASPALAQATAPVLVQTAPNAIVSDTYTNSLNTPPETRITGNVCFTTGPATPPVLIIGATVTPCPAPMGAEQIAALGTLNGQACTSLGAGAIALNAVSIAGGPLGNFPPGCYSSGGAMTITLSTEVILTGAGVYVFRPGGAITTGANSRVRLAGGACANDVFWAPVGATTLGANAATTPLLPTFVGNIFRGSAAGLSITLGQFANLQGRALAFGSTVTTDSNTISIPTCAVFAPAAPAPGTPGGPPCPVITLSPTTLSSGTVGVAYSQTVTAGNSTAPDTTYSFLLTGSLPPGLTLSAAGVISGTPLATGTGGTYSFTIRATDPSGCFGVADYTMITLTAVPTLPQLFVALLALGLLLIGYVQLRRGAGDRRI